MLNTLFLEGKVTNARFMEIHEKDIPIIKEWLPIIIEAQKAEEYFSFYKEYDKIKPQNKGKGGSYSKEETKRINEWNRQWNNVNEVLTKYDIIIYDSNARDGKKPNKVGKFGRELVKAGGLDNYLKKIEEEEKRKQRLKDLEVEVPLSTIKHHSDQRKHGNITRRLSLIAIAVSLSSASILGWKLYQESNNKAAILQLQKVDSLRLQEVIQIKNSIRGNDSLILILRSKVDSTR